MENNNNPSGAPAARRDGTIDFSRYSTEQLTELQHSFGSTTSPLNHAALLEELGRRNGELPATPHWTVRLTRLNGLRGWVEALWRRQPMYGEGSLTVDSGTLILGGRQRTWLGIPIERALSWPLGRIRNVAVARSAVRFEVARRGWFPRKVEVQLANTSLAAEVVGALPGTRTARFERQGLPLLAFEEHLKSRCRSAWLTPLLVFCNILLFAAACVSVGQIASPESSRIVFWSANIGPLTLEGQWWRLATALFTHGSVLHLVLNMWALWHIGRLTERLFGRWTFLCLYLGCGVLASASTLLWDPARSSVGASGAIFGLFGAFLAVLVNPEIRMPRGVFRAHWIPTLLFTGYNLVAGAVTPGVDHASHVGGLLGGLALGFLLSRPVEQKSRTAGWKALAASIVVLAFISGSLLFLGKQRGPVPVPQQFANTHQWYVTGEARNLAAWDRLARMAAAGAISDADLGAQFARDVVPFWEAALPRMQREVLRSTGVENAYLAAVARFVQIRRDWARALVLATRDRDEEQAGLARELSTANTAALAEIQRLTIRSQASHLPGGLTNLGIVNRARRSFDTKAANCILDPDLRKGSPGSPTDGPAMAVDAGCTAQLKFRSEQFAALDASLKQQSESLGDLPHGGSSLHASWGGLGDLFEYGGEPVEIQLRRLAQWRRSVPGSEFPDLAESMLFNVWAWSARGHGYASQVSQQAFAAFEFRNEMAWATLQAGPSAALTPLKCSLSMRLQHDRAAGLDEIRKTLDSCISQFPRDHSLYSLMLRSLMPRWSGSAEAVSGFIQEIATPDRTSDPDALYARLYWIYGSLERDDVNIFTDTYAEWPRMRAGFERLLVQHPRSDAVRNAYARFACLAGDADAYRSLRRSIEGHLSADSWTTKTTVSSCDGKMSVN